MNSPLDTRKTFKKNLGEVRASTLLNQLTRLPSSPVSSFLLAGSIGSSLSTLSFLSLDSFQAFSWRPKLTMCLDCALQILVMIQTMCKAPDSPPSLGVLGLPEAPYCSSSAVGMCITTSWQRKHKESSPPGQSSFALVPEHFTDFQTHCPLHFYHFL